mmetsp:Transcript_587/g.1800  ORF Transcript_587/g.1800 Transcript_587/m.1800 type:complete len:239 (+) Transcript_587:910-1626(+)
MGDDPSLRFPAHDALDRPRGHDFASLGVGQLHPGPRQVRGHEVGEGVDARAGRVHVLAFIGVAAAIAGGLGHVVIGVTAHDLAPEADLRVALDLGGHVAHGAHDLVGLRLAQADACPREHLSLLYKVRHRTGHSDGLFLLGRRHLVEEPRFFDVLCEGRDLLLRNLCRAWDGGGLLDEPAQDLDEGVGILRLFSDHTTHDFAQVVIDPFLFQESAIVERHCTQGRESPQQLVAKPDPA